MGSLEMIPESSFDQAILQSGQPVLVEFGAEWCGPCKQLAPLLVQLAKDYQGKVRVVQVDVDACPQVTTQFGVMSVPTLILFKHGQAVQRSSGYQSREKLVRLFFQSSSSS